MEQFAYKNATNCTTGRSEEYKSGMIYLSWSNGEETSSWTHELHKHYDLEGIAKEAYLEADKEKAEAVLRGHGFICVERFKDDTRW